MSPKITAVNYELSDALKNGYKGQTFALHGDGGNDLVVDPGVGQRIPKTGAWIMVTRQLPSLERDLDREFRVGRIFYAVHDSTADDAGFLPNGTYKVLVTSPWGDVWLWPYEYASIDTDSIVAMWQAGEVRFQPTEIDVARLNEIVFYAQTRGIGLADAAVMALGTLEGNVGWFEPHPDVSGGTGGRALRDPLCPSRGRAGGWAGCSGGSTGTVIGKFEHQTVTPGSSCALTLRPGGQGSPGAKRWRIPDGSSSRARPTARRG